MGVLIKWFKHYSNVSDSVKLNALIDKYGLEGYGRYWLLLELLSSHWDGGTATISLHLRTIAKQLRYYKLTSAKEWLNNGETMGFYGLDIEADVYTFTAPILLELQSKDYKYEKSKRNGNDPKNKTKNKIKNKTNTSESLNASSKIDFQFYMDHWNDSMSNVLSKVIQLTPKRKTSIRTLLKKYPDFNIDDYFARIRASSFLTGSTDWKADFSWCFVHGNYLKVIEGRYDDNKGKFNIDDLELS